MTDYSISNNQKHWKNKLISHIFNNEFKGQIHVVLPNKKSLNLGQGDIVCTIYIKRYLALFKIFFSGVNGIAECYKNDWIDCPDLLGLFRWGIDNSNHVNQKTKRGKINTFLRKRRHSSNTNSLTGSKKNISFHYDLGNQFYQYWLDESMTYSSALFYNQHESLLQAQANKYHRIIDLLSITPEDRVLEIGCGWGGFARCLPQHQSDQHQYLGISLSQQQLNYAKQQSKHEFAYLDYRHITGQYDKIVSIEMFEAVGQRYWQEYFSVLNRSLKQGGQAVLQIITIEENRFEQYSQEMDFIQEYIFPGGMLPTQKHIEQLAEDSGFDLIKQQTFGQDYAKTLELWNKAFLQNFEQIQALGFDEPFKRLWTFYLQYCQAGFEKGSIDVGFYQLQKRAEV